MKDYQTVKNLTLYPPTSDKIGRKMDRLRKEIIQLGCFLEDELEPSRELSLALTKLEEVCYNAIAAVARNQEKYGE